MQGLWKKAINQKERQRVGYRDEQKKKTRQNDRKYQIQAHLILLEIGNGKHLTPLTTKDLRAPTPTIPLRTNLPKLSRAPILRDPHTSLIIHTTIHPASGFCGDGNDICAAVEAFTQTGDAGGHVEVFAAVAGDGVHDGAAFALAFVAVVLEVEFGVGEGGGGEEDEAEGC